MCCWEMGKTKFPLHPIARCVAEAIELKKKAMVETIRTRRFAACTQAVVILRSTSYIAIELNVLHLKVVRNSIESMCSSYSVFDCISWNRLIAYYSFAGL